MSFEKFFRLISYAAVFCGFLSLWVSGTFGSLGTVLFIGIMIGAWFLEDTGWQISERIGTLLIVLALPVFYFLWRLRFFGFSNMEGVLPGILARMILVLAAIKLLQKKSDRDWIFLYLMSFFEVLLAAGLSISALYLVSFLGYLLVTVCAVIAFEIRKTLRSTSTRKDPKHAIFFDNDQKLANVPVRRLPSTALVLIVLAAVVGIPLFFLLPRVGGAGFGSDQNKVSASTGFSDSVKLGGSGSISQSDAVVMRVRLDDNSALLGDTHWRGVALDKFDNLTWSKSGKVSKQVFARSDRDLIQVDIATGHESLSTQTVYLEPLDTPVLFGLSKIVGLQGDFPFLTKDSEGSVTVPKGGDRTSYKVVSDRSLPSPDRLHADNDPYSTEMGNYLATPDAGLDPRIAKLAFDITSKYSDRLSKAIAVESYLQNNFGYTLEMKAGGPQPLADFLFNVKEGHCEYFATAMAVMLRTQGIATRVVNGFQQGEYNDAADIWIVRQRDAHSWVEVYFPHEKTWVAFDPTPFSGQTSGGSTSGIFGSINKYLDALDTYWVEYFVAFDDQEQQSIARSARKSFSDYQEKAAFSLNALQEMLAGWWARARGDEGLARSGIAIAYALASLSGIVIALGLFVWMYRKVVKSMIWARVLDRFRGIKSRTPVVEFYERMQQVLTKRGYARDAWQTPMEFASAVGMPEAVNITEKYNMVRFGAKDLSQREQNEIEELIKSLQDENT